MKDVISVMVLLATTTSGGNSKEYDIGKIMVDAKKEIIEDLRQLAINRASSRKFSCKKFTEL